jgi:hypothetical protein
LSRIQDGEALGAERDRALGDELGLLDRPRAQPEHPAALVRPRPRATVSASSGTLARLGLARGRLAGRRHQRTDDRDHLGIGGELAHRRGGARGIAARIAHRDPHVGTRGHAPLGNTPAASSTPCSACSPNAANGPGSGSTTPSTPRAEE